MKVEKLRELLQKYDGETEVIITCKDNDEWWGYSLKDEIGEGGIPSNIIELFCDEQVVG